jgi:hypothetical protein
MANDTNQVAPVSMDNANVTVTNANSTDDATKAGVDATKNPADVAPAFDPRTSYDGLKTQFETLNKSYAELRKFSTQQSQGYAALKKQLEDLTHVFKEATKEEISPEDFMKALQTQGVKAFDPLKQQWTGEVKSEYDKVIEQIQTERTNDRVLIEDMRRQIDSATYPDYAKLKPLMNDIANSEQCPIDWSQDISVIYDTLYKLAKAVSAESAMKEAHAQGLKEAEAKIAREAGTAVATGGKAASVSNPADIKDLGKLREYFVAQLGEAE